MDPRLIEIRGIGFPNKGAELMLDACLQFIRGIDASARVTVIPTGNREASLAQLHARGLEPRLRYWRGGINWDPLIVRIPRWLRNGWTVSGEEDVILDASGFAYGDVWGAKRVGHRVVSQEIALRRNRDLKLVFLPQAFGPFTRRDVRERVSRLLDPAKLVYARDPESLDHLATLGFRDDRVRLCPDFTNSLAPAAAPTDEFDDAVCFIPNEKIFSFGDAETESRYIDLFVRVVRRVLAAGERCYFLLHEGAGDRRTIDKINDALGASRIQTATFDDALATRALIGRAKLVVGSRFHGLVSALSQSVPAVGIGWSHKYRALFDDYGMGRFAFLFPETHGIMDRVDELLDATVRGDLLDSLRVAESRIGDRVAQMWRDVAAAIGS